jgi:hypothetical protein
MYKYIYKTNNKSEEKTKNSIKMRKNIVMASKNVNDTLRENNVRSYTEKASC